MNDSLAIEKLLETERERESSSYNRGQKKQNKENETRTKIIPPKRGKRERRRERGTCLWI
jgi:hypothetical protein